MITSSPRALYNDPLHVFDVIPTLVVWFGVSIIVHLVSHHNSMLHDKKCSWYDCEARCVCVRRPQDDVGTMHILQEGPPVGSTERLVVVHLQKAAGRGDPCRGVPITLDENMK